LGQLPVKIMCCSIL